MNILNHLSRLDEEAFQEILGREVIGTLNALGSKYIYSENLLKILTKNYPDSELLTRKAPRTYLINIMNKDEIILLANTFKLPLDDKVYANVINLNFKG